MITNPKAVHTTVTFDEMDQWNSLLEQVKPDLDEKGLARLKNVLDGKCKSVVIERHYIDKDYRDTFSHFHSKRFSTPPSRCVRLHFFSKAVKEREIIEAVKPGKMAKKVGQMYLGYAVIRPTKPNCLGRTLLSHKLRCHPQAHLSTCEEQVNLLGTPLTVEGFPFISQDVDATVCAQSALWMLLRYYSNRYAWYPEILPFQITNLANNHGVGSRLYPTSGLYSWQLAEALRLQRFAPVIYSRRQFEKQQHGIEFDHLLYTYVESGLPLLVTVPQHVMVGYGHVSDYGAEAPAKPGPEFLYTSWFNRGFVVSDDNCFPYQTLWQNGPGKSNNSKYPWSEIEEFIVPLPEKVFLTAEQVQPAIEKVLKDRMATSPGLAGRRLVFRLFLTSARAFKRKLRARGMGHRTVERVYRSLPMPHFMWVCELADYSEYATNRHVLGEIIWDATRNAQEPNGWIALHLPDRLEVDIGSAFNSHQRLQTFPLTGQKSYFLFQSNLHSL